MRRAAPLAAAALIVLLGPVGTGSSAVRVAHADELTLEDPGDLEDVPDAPPESDDEEPDRDQGEGHGRPGDDLNGGAEELPTQPAVAPSPRDARPDPPTRT